jgi:hypothetical protein
MFAYKKLLRDENGNLRPLFVNSEKIFPVNEWIKAEIPFHFPSINGRWYVPAKTGSSVTIPDTTILDELVDRGYCTRRAYTIKAVAFRPGIHCCSLPYFPQGGIKDPYAPYGHRHESNAVFCQIEIADKINYTEKARGQSKAYSKAGKFIPRYADLNYLPENGFYYYSTNLRNKDCDRWMITEKIRIVRELTRAECDEIMVENGLMPQLWAE